MGNWQKCLSSWAIWWNIPNPSQPNPGSPGDVPLNLHHQQTVLPPPEIGLHERRCPFSLLQCQWPGCPFVGTYYDHARHTELYHSGGIDDRRPRGAQDYRQDLYSVTLTPIYSGVQDILSEVAGQGPQHFGLSHSHFLEQS